MGRPSVILALVARPVVWRGRLSALSTRRLRRAGRPQAQPRVRGVEASRINRRGLPVGVEAPRFALPDLDGNERTLEAFLGEQVLLVFSDPHCPPCDELASELVELDERCAGELSVVMVSRGAPDANRAKVREHGFGFPVLLQQGWGTSKQYGLLAAPVAYLLDESGVVAREAAVGKDAIVRLVETIRR